MIKLSRKAKCFVILILFLFVVILLGSIDRASVDDKGLLSTMPEIRDVDNGYSIIAYIHEPDFSLFENSDERQLLYDVLNGRDKNAHALEAFLARHQKTLGDIRKASNYAHFKLKIPDPISSLPSYSPLSNLAELLISESMNFARRGDIDLAIESVNTALKFSVRLALDANKYIITHVVAMDMQGMILRWAHRLAVEYELTQTQFVVLIASIEAIPTYENDGFEGTFAGEFYYVSEHFRQYPTPFASRYHVHSNRVLSSRAEIAANLAEQTSSYCHQLELPDSLGSGGIKIWDYLVPNGLAGQFVGGDYKNYFEKRCMRYAHRQSVKAIIALQRYRARTGHYPDSLEALVPEDIRRIPIDPFDGQGIKYHASSHWVYSSGTNFMDNKGSETSFYDSGCQLNLDCMQNPTFPLKPYAWYVPSVKTQECTPENAQS